jgi:DNA (cytosine-5)-methyltransferase 1
LDKKRIVAVDVFCGAGGLAYGLMKSGISVRAGIDLDATCRYPFEKNIRGATFLHSDARNVSRRELNRIWGKGVTRLLAGCAPCQPFSNYKQGSQRLRDDRWNLLGEFGRLVLETLPELVTMENVPQLQRHKVFDQFCEQLLTNAYSLRIEQVDCRDFGVPQRRKRLVLIAWLGSRRLPELKTLSSRPVTVRQAIGCLPLIDSGEVCLDDPLHRTGSLSSLNLARLVASRPGGTWRDWPLALRTKCHLRKKGDGYGAVYGRMEWDKPAPTLTTQCYNYGSGRFGHPEQHRAISLREAAVLQGFPKDYDFEPIGQMLNKRLISRLIGNAVPPPLGYAIGKAFLAGNSD